MPDQLIYCPTCRVHLVSPDPACPPYAAVHTGTGEHLHPITRAVVAVEEVLERA